MFKYVFMNILRMVAIFKNNILFLLLSLYKTLFSKENSYTIFCAIAIE